MAMRAGTRAREQRERTQREQQRAKGADLQREARQRLFPCRQASRKLARVRLMNDWMN